MKLKTNYNLDFEDLNQIYYNLLLEEDFNFKNKNIKINLTFDKVICVEVLSNSFLELKIGNLALIKSLEIINKTLKI